jgi:hypothetical protein
VIACPTDSSQSFFGFGQTADVLIKLSDAETRKKVDIKGEGEEKLKLPVYYDGESVSGQVCVYVCMCVCVYVCVCVWVCVGVCFELSYIC